MDIDIHLFGESFAYFKESRAYASEEDQQDGEVDVDRDGQAVDRCDDDGRDRFLFRLFLAEANEFEVGRDAMERSFYVAEWVVFWYFVSGGYADADIAVIVICFFCHGEGGVCFGVL